MPLDPQSENVRSQIEAVKTYLRDAGFADVEDPAEVQPQSFEGLHTIWMVWKDRRALRISYGWMKDSRELQLVRSCLEGHSIAEKLKIHREVKIHDAGRIEAI